MSKSSTQTTKTQMDPAQREILLDLYSRGKAVADTPYQAYGGETIAGFSTPQLQAQQMATSGALGNVGGEALNQALGGTQAVMGYNPMQVQTGSALDNLGAYMNPYLQNVAGGVLSNLDRSRQLAQQGTSAQAAAAGAYGGSRHGVADAETNRNFFDVAGQQLNNIFSQGYNAATGLATSDLARQLQAQQLNQSAGLTGQQLNLGAANQLAGLSDQQRQQLFGNAAMLEGVGAQQQAMEQAQLDQAQAQWREAQNYPRQQVEFLSGITGNMPSLGGTTTAPVSRNVGAGALGGALAGAQLFGTGGALAGTAGITGGMGAAGGALLGLLSDQNIKSGRRPVRDEDVLAAFERTPIERWRYDPAKGGPDDGGVEHIGPMAQSVAENLGIGNGRSIPVVDMMGTQMAATKALAKKVRKLEGKKK